jgi:para-nitrobenzyl esterase
MSAFPRRLPPARAWLVPCLLLGAVLAAGRLPLPGRTAGTAPAQDDCTTDVRPAPGVAVTDRGAVRGVPDGATYAFQGVPYAAPPVGALRFRPPAAAACWDGERPATAFGPPCPQPAGGGVTGEEDCLYLNVWTPAAVTGDAPLPVMVFIHGGGNVQGSPAQPVYNGRALAEHGAVVVTVSYRLGALGFLTHPALAAESAQGVSGNYGLLDQIAALRWVQRNIGAFGGDPGRVLIFGESAGGVNVCALLAAPAAAGLFHRAVIQSGGCPAPTRTAAERIGARVAAATGCATAADVAACLRALPAADLVTAVPVDVGAVRLVPPEFGPHVDGVVLPAAPLEAVRAGRHNRVPLIVGANADETSQMVGRIATEDEYRAAVYALLGQSLGELVLVRYPVAEHGTPRGAFIAATSDARFICPARVVARTVADAQPEPVYRYFFTHALEGPARALGAFHGLELAFVFGTLGTTSGYRPSDAERALAEALIGYWTRFAAAGDPNGAGAVPWPAYDPATDPYLQLDTPIAAGMGVRTAHCDFWEQLR